MKEQNNFFTLSSLLGKEESRADIISMLKSDSDTYNNFLLFPPSYQEHLIQFFMGQQGLEILFNNMFQRIMDPENRPERLEDFLSNFLGEKVKIVKILPREGIHLSEYSSFVIMDILVELSDSSIVNVEVQKVGYKFPGERSDCYVSDLIMRQYNRVRKEKGAKFTYGDLKPVFVIILLEESPLNIKQAYPDYIHKRIVEYNTNVEITNLANVYFVSLDIFHSVVHNISNKLDAWLMFLSSSDCESIISLVNQYPEFAEYYKEISQFRHNPKELICMFSEALKIMDHNTILLMKKEREEELNALKDTIEQNKAIIEQNKATIEQNKATIEQNKATIEQNKATIAQKDEEIQRLMAEVAALKK